MHPTKLTEADASELKLDSYVMHIHTNHCKCGSGERYGLMYEVWVHPTKTRLTGFRELRPARGSLRDLPIAYVDLPEQALQICSDCVHDYKSPTHQSTLPAASAAEWAATLRRKYTPEPKEIKIARASAESKIIPAPRPEDL